MRIGLRNLGLIFLGVVAPLSMSMATAADSPATAENAGDFAAKSKGSEVRPPSRPVAERLAPRSSPAGSSAAETSLLFRRVLVPEAQIKDWPRSNLRYLPIDAAEFERLLEGSRRTTDGSRPPADAQILQARYSAELAEAELVAGRAVLRVSSFSKSPTLLPLDPCRLALDTPQWRPERSSNSAGAAKTVSLGIGPDGKLAVRVAQSGQLEFSWTLRGQRETGGALAFSLQLPQCPSNQLELTLPADLIPTVDQALVSALQGTDSAAGLSAAATGGGAARPAVRRWLIELGGQNLAVVRIAKRDLTHQRRPLTLARQSLTYEFSPRGLQLSAELKLDVLGEPIRQIALDLDSPLTLVTARYGEAQLMWSEEGADAGDDGLPKIALDKLRSALDDLGVAYPTHSRSHRVVLQLPEPLRGSGRVVRIGAVAPLPVSGRLPSIRPASAELIWQEGSATLLVPLPLELSELRTVGCRQTRQELLPAPTRGDAITLQCFRPDADVYVGLRRQQDRFQLQSGTAIDIRSTSIRGRTVAELTAEQGECFSLSADVSTSWAIDSVESSPAGSIASWTVDSSPGAAQRLIVNLAKAVRSDRPLRLIIGGRWWRAPLGETLKSDDLPMLRFRGMHTSRQIVGIHAVPTFRIQLTGSENLNRLNPEHLDPTDAALLDGAIAGTLFVADARAAALTVGVARETPKYSGAITLMLKADDDSLSESYAFTCTPDSTEIDRLLVYFPRPRAEPLVWEITGAQKSGLEASEPIVARKLKRSASARAGLGLAAGDVWELTWRQPRSEPFTIRASRTIPLDAPLPVSLASFVQADSQQGFVEVRSVGEHIAEIQNRRLQPATVPPQSSDRWPAVLAAYRYDPQEEAILAANDPLPGLTVGPGKSPPKAWVWSLRVDSHYSAQGRGEHFASWRIENMGRSRVSFRMPTEFVLHAAWIDGTVISNPSPDEATGQLRLELPTDRRFTTIGLKWASDGQPLSIVSSRSVVLPEIVDLPVLSRRVSLWLPPNYRLMESDAGRQSAGGVVSWSQRLFGPFGRPPNQAPFDPLASDDWSRTVDALALHDRVGLQARRFVARIATFASESNATAKRPKSTWGELLARTQLETVEANERRAPLLIDGQALGDIGLLPETSISTTSRGDSDHNASPLEVADLTILVSPTALVLTTRSAALGLTGRNAAPVESLVAWRPSGPLVEQLREAEAGSGSRFVPVEFWSLPRPVLPWSPAMSDLPLVDHAGWIEYHLDSLDGSSFRIWVVRRDAMIGVGCALFLLTTLLTWQNRTLTGRTLALIVATVAALALTIPPEFAPLGAAVWMGLGCGWIVRWLARARMPTNSPSDTAAPPRAAIAAARTVVVLVVMLAIGSPWLRGAEQNPPSDDTTRATIYDVLVPVDDQQRPTGRELLVPEPLYQRMAQRAGRRTETPHDWLITRAMYRGRLGHGVGLAALGATDWTARYDLETFNRQIQIQIPFGGEGTNLVPDGVRLDGTPIQFEWRNSGRSLAIEIPEAGPHQLELVFRPSAQVSNSAMAIDMAILPLASSQLQLELPADLQVEIPSAKGHLARDQGGQRLVGALGSADRLTIRWGDGAAFDSGPALIDADELLWMKIRPGSVVLESRFDIRVAEGQLRQVQLVADPRLRRLPLEGGSPIAQVRAESDGSNAIDLGLARPITDQVAFKVSFLLTDSSGIGNLQMPKLAILGARKLSRRLAVSIESPLETDEKSLERLKAIPVSDFLSAWGGAESKPQVAFLLLNTDGNPDFAVHSREPQLTSNDSLQVSFDEQRLQATWMTDVSVQGGAINQLHISAPRQFRVDEALISEPGGASRPVRWSRGLFGGITLFLPGPPADRYRLMIRGETSHPLDTTTSLPDLRIEGCKVESQAVLVLRKPDVLATVSDRGGLAEQSGKELQQTVDHAVSDGLIDRKTLAIERFVAALAGKASTGPVSVRIARNAPRVEGSETITMRRDGDAWAAVVDLDLKVSGGVLDVLRFDLPSQSNAPILAEPAIPQEFVESTGEERRQLVLRPAEPIAGAQHIRLTIPVPASGGQRVRVPDVRPVNLGQLHRFVRLPTNFNEQQLAWDPRGLKFEPLPGNFTMTSPTTEIYRIGDVIGDRFEATLKSIEKGTAGPRVRLADIRIVSPDGNTGYGTAAFDLDPAGGATCLLDMPPEFRLVHVQLNDGPAMLKQMAPNQWSVALGAARLPQRMEVVFRVDRASDGAASGPAFRAPSLIGFSVEQTLWSIDSPQPVELASDQPGTKRVSSLDGRLIELQAAAAMFETTASLLPNDSEQQVSQFVTLDARRALLVRSEVDRERKRSLAAGEDRAVNAAIRAIEAARVSLARKFDLQKLFGDLSSQSRIARGPSEIIRLAGGDDDATTTFASTDQSGLLALAPMARPNDGFAARLLTALAAALIVVGLFWLAGREEFAEAAAKWPEWLVVVAGLCWWFWLAPSFIGCGIIVASIAAGFWRRRVRRRLTDLSSPRSPRGLSSAATSVTPNSQWGQTPDRPAAID